MVYRQPINKGQTMTKQQAKNLGENVGIFMVCVGLAALYMPLMHLLVFCCQLYVGDAQ